AHRRGSPTHRPARTCPRRFRPKSRSAPPRTPIRRARRRQSLGLKVGSASPRIVPAAAANPVALAWDRSDAYNTRMAKLLHNADIANDPRARQLLRTLVSRHVRDGDPVGSQTLARHSGLDVSPATIRNILASMEDAGLLSAPHSSA